MKDTLVAADLSKLIDGRVLFDGHSLRVSAGEAVAIMGPSGIGKTTFLRCLNGLTRADRGTISVGGETLRADDNPSAFASAALRVRRKVGFVFQSCHLFAHQTVLQNVIEAPCQVRRESVPSATRKANALLKQFGIADRSRALPRELSGGEQQRAAIARALAMEPEVLLLDEPTSALDAERGEELARALRDLMQGGLSLVVVTHDPTFARSLGARMEALAGRKALTPGGASPI